MLTSGSLERDRAFYLTTALANVRITGVLSRIAAEREARLRSAPEKCDVDVGCYSDEIRLSDAESRLIAAELPSVAGALASTHLRPSGMFALRAGGSDAELLMGAWRDTLDAMHASYDAYAATLDGATLKAVVTAAGEKRGMAFFEPELHVVLGALSVQGRTEATRYEPPSNHQNDAALAAVATTDWGRWPYSAIVVLGLGGEASDVPLTEGGRRHCDLAAARYAAGYAPFIIVSGGNVHPDRTPYNEAVEMKKYLMNQYAIAESAILTEPYARHTTTNLRNAARLALRYGFPLEQPLLITTNTYQTWYMAPAHGIFGPRCDRELGYRPWRALAPVSPNDTRMLVSPLALQADGRDPLDP